MASEAPAAPTDVALETAPAAGTQPTTERGEALYASGITCVNDLTDALFFEAHPEARGVDGQSRVVELGLAETWTTIRNTIARPVVAAHQPRAAESASVALDATKTLVYDTIAADPARYAAISEDEMNELIDLAFYADVDFSAITAGCAVAFDVDADNTITHAPYRASSDNAFSKNGHTIVQVRRTTAKGATEVTRAPTEAGAPSPEAAAAPSADVPTAAAGSVAELLGRYATGYAMGMYASLDEEGLGRELAARSASDPQLVRSVFRALYDADRDDVALAMVTALPRDAALRACGPELLRELGDYLDGGMISWTSGSEASAAGRVRALVGE